MAYKGDPGRGLTEQSNRMNITTEMDLLPELVSYSSLLTLTVVLFFILVGWRVRNSRRNAHLPPSPPSDPIIGHYRIFPRSYQAEAFFEWSKTYGMYQSQGLVGTTEQSLTLTL